MYQNLFHHHDTNTIHLWDDVRGHTKFPYSRYAYKKNPKGERVSIFGDRVTKVSRFNSNDPDVFESDVPSTTRTLVDLYTDSDEVSEGHVTMIFDIEVEMETGKPNAMESEQEITAIGFHEDQLDEYYVYILDKDNKIEESQQDNVYIIPFSNEKNLLMAFLTKYQEIRPTILSHWNGDRFDIPYLYNRLKRLFGWKVANSLSPIGVVEYNSYRNKFFIAGVASLDYMNLYKKFTFNELDNYRLDTIGRKEVDLGKLEYNGSLDDLFREDIKAFIKYNLIDVEIIVKLDKKLQYIDLARGICHVGHVPYEDYEFSSRYLEGAILTYLRKQNLVAPNKSKIRYKFNPDEFTPKGRTEIVVSEEIPEHMISNGLLTIQKTKSSSFVVEFERFEGNTFYLTEPLKEVLKPEYEIKPKLPGAFVKDPITGKHNWAYDLDLTSLYPSIIMSLNISPETKIGKIENWDSAKHVRNEIGTYIIDGNEIPYEKMCEFLEKSNYGVSPNGVLYRMDKVGCIPDILDTWFNKRADYRKLEKKYGLEGDDDQYAFYNKRQMVQKILLNSMYGALGLPSFRFYDVDNATAVTSTGRSVIKNTADVANLKYNKELETKGEDYNIYIDTDSIFFSAVPLLDHRHPGWKELPDEKTAQHVDAIAGEMQDYINRFYDIFAKKFFNLDHHRFEIKKEFVIKAGMWVAKKRYAQHIIANNGVPVDELNVKGLDVVRSNFPKSFREFMSEILMDILKDKTKAQIDEKILTFRENLSNIDIREIAKSSSIKNLSKYQVANKNRLFEFPPGSTAHAKAALSFNDLLEYYECPHRYAPFEDGDKLKWVYLKDNPFYIESLAFRGYEDPDEIVDFINKFVDYDRIFQSDLENKFNDFYTALDWGIVSTKPSHADKFFEF